jgi:hypothetical protein
MSCACGECQNTARALTLEQRTQAARAWMEGRGIHQLGTEHLNQQQQRRLVSAKLENELTEQI